jgi:CheY-like chemotaxis protein
VRVREDQPAKLRILVVEDEWLVRTAISQFLEAAGCRVIEAQNGEKAIEVLHNGDHINVVFTDIRLGGNVNGWDVAEASRANDPAIGVIYTSGESISPPREVAGSTFFTKPYDPAKVLDACERLYLSRE